MKIALLEDDNDYQELIGKMLNDLGYINIVFFSSIIEVEKYAQISKIDLLISDYFLGNGVTVADLLKTKILAKRTKIIVLTNYFEDAVYEELHRLRKIFFLKKGLGKLELRNALEATIHSTFSSELEGVLEKRVFIKIGSALKPIDLDNIMYIEVDGKYINVCLANYKSYPIRSTLTEFNNKLPKNFIRIHAAFVVNIDHIQAVSLKNKAVLMNDKEIPFSRSYRSDLFSKIPLS